MAVIEKECGRSVGMSLTYRVKMSLTLSSCTQSVQSGLVFELHELVSGDKRDC
jgi:hypothetical protein